MTVGKLILASCTVGPMGYVMGWSAAWLYRAEAPSLFGVIAGAALVLIAMLPGGGSGISHDGTKQVDDIDLSPETNGWAIPMVGDIDYVPPEVLYPMDSD